MSKKARNSVEHSGGMYREVPGLSLEGGQEVLTENGEVISNKGPKEKGRMSE